MDIQHTRSSDGCPRGGIRLIEGGSPTVRQGAAAPARPDSCVPLSLWRNLDGLSINFCPNARCINSRGRPARYLEYQRNPQKIHAGEIEENYRRRVSDEGHTILGCRSCGTEFAQLDPDLVWRELGRMTAWLKPALAAQASEKALAGDILALHRFLQDPVKNPPPPRQKFEMNADIAASIRNMANKANAASARLEMPCLKTGMRSRDAISVISADIFRPLPQPEFSPQEDIFVSLVREAGSGYVLSAAAFYAASPDELPAPDAASAPLVIPAPLYEPPRAGERGRRVNPLYAIPAQLHAISPLLPRLNKRLHVVCTSSPFYQIALDAHQTTYRAAMRRGFTHAAAVCRAGDGAGLADEGGEHLEAIKSALLAEFWFGRKFKKDILHCEMWRQLPHRPDCKIHLCSETHGNVNNEVAMLYALAAPDTAREARAYFTSRIQRFARWYALSQGTTAGADLAAMLQYVLDTARRNYNATHASPPQPQTME